MDERGAGKEGAVWPTLLYEVQVASHAHMVELAGWKLPLYFTGILDEHESIRKAVGLFGISHIGEIEVQGMDALKSLQRLLTPDLAKFT